MQTTLSDTNVSCAIHPNEEKVMEGVYLTRQKSETKQPSTENKGPKYFYKSTAELIAILEIDFEHIIKEIEMLYHANQQMLEYDPTDYDLIKARQDNVVLINNKLKRLTEIQEELKRFCPTNPFVTKNVFDFLKELNITERELTNQSNETSPEEKLDEILL
jgi:hypothetical protein